MKPDPFTVSIIQNSLIAAAEESFVRFGRSSQSPIIYEVLDYACGLTDGRGDLVAQANGVPGFLGTLSFAVKALIEKFQNEGLSPGDLFITNDPYSGGGNHLSDVALIMPVFADLKAGDPEARGADTCGLKSVDGLKSLGGRTPVAFCVNKAHWTEVGGMAPGSWTTDSTEIYQEGLQFPLIRLGGGYTPDPALLDLIAANVRTPERTLGDLFAGIAALRVAESRVAQIVDKHGEALFRDSVRAILDQGEIAARRALEGLPKGTYRAEEWMDDDGLSDAPVHVQVEVTISRRVFRADFTGSSLQVRGSINCTRTRLQSACRSMFKSVTDPRAPLNDGWFRPLEVVCPEGTVFTATRPAPVSTYWETGAYAVDLLWKALFPVLADRLTAGHFLSICGTIIGGRNGGGEGVEDGDKPELGGDKQAKTFILVEPQAGGWGAGATKDGESGLVAVGDGETYMMPVEVCESRYPLLVEQYAFDLNERGNGKYRGGFGLVKDYRVLCARAFVTATFGRHKYPPWGCEGGEDGSPNGVAVFSRDDVSKGNQDPALWTGKVARYPLGCGDVVRLITGKGGGYGSPTERDHRLVREDVVQGFLSLGQARAVYGVVIDPETLDIDEEKTSRLEPRGSQAAPL